MTISIVTRKTGPFPGDDLTTEFDFDWKVFESDDVRVVRVDPLGLEAVLVQDTDYEVSLNADQNVDPGGTITLLLGALATGYILWIVSVVDSEQNLELPSTGPWNPRVVETAFDKAMATVQQTEEKLARAVLFPVSEQLTGQVEFPGAAVRANKALGFNADGDLIAGGNFVSGAVTVSAFMETLLDDASAASGLATLGFSVFSQSLRGLANADSYLTAFGFGAFGKTMAATASASDALDALGFSAFGKTIINDTDPSDLLATLGFGAFGESFIASADAATALSTLGFSAFGVTWSGLADAAAGRTALALGTLATQNAATVAITGGSITGITDLAIADGGTGAGTALTAFNALAASGGTVGGTLTFADNEILQPRLTDASFTLGLPGSAGGVLTINYASGNYQFFQLTENVTSVLITNPPANGIGGELTLVLKNHASAAKTVAWGAAYLFPGGTDHVMTNAVDAVDMLRLRTLDGGTSWLVTFENDLK